MSKTLFWFTFILSSGPALAAGTLKLECEDHGDGSYSCVEISRSAGAPRATPKAEPTVAPAHLEKARQECTFQRPRTRPGGQKGGGAALRAEQEKAAQEAYDRCLRDAAARIRQEEHREQ
jgi:hypothetical protein